MERGETFCVLLGLDKRHEWQLLYTTTQKSCDQPATTAVVARKTRGDDNGRCRSLSCLPRACAPYRAQRSQYPGPTRMRKNSAEMEKSAGATATRDRSSPERNPTPAAYQTSKEKMKDGTWRSAWKTKARKPRREKEQMRERIRLRVWKKKKCFESRP